MALSRSDIAGNVGKLEIVYAAGARIAGKYRVERILGSGGMGVVVAAEHEELRSRVALKFLAPELAQRADVVERFLREARVCAQLRSEHVCRVSDFGRLETGAPYIVMEMLDGLDLANVLAANGALAVPTIASYIVQACDALAEAHAAGIVHRDLKPANLFLARRRDGGALIKVLDFGVAKIQGPRDHALTRTDMIVGSPLYMAPEQFGSALAADARSDIWSLGVILYELAAGRPPFTGPAVDIAFQIDREPAPRLTGVPDGFARAVARCLDKAPERRFQRIADLVAALRPFLPRDADTTIRGMSGNPDEVSDRSTLRMTPQQLRARPGKPGAPAGAPLPGVAPSPSAPSPEAAYPEGTPPLMKAQVADAAIASFVLRGDTHEVTGPARGAEPPTRVLDRGRQRAASPQPGAEPRPASPRLGTHPAPGSGPRAAIPASGPRAAIPASGPRELPASGPRAVVAPALPASGPRAVVASALPASGPRAVVAPALPASGPRAVVAPALLASGPRAVVAPEVHARPVYERLADWRSFLPRTWRTPRRSMIAGTVGAVSLCLVIGTLLSLLLGLCTHVRGVSSAPTAEPSPVALHAP